MTTNPADNPPPATVPAHDPLDDWEDAEHDADGETGTPASPLNAPASVPAGPRAFVFGGGSGSAARLDIFLASQMPDTTRSQIQRLIIGGGATVNGDMAKTALKLKTGDRVTIIVPEARGSHIEAQDISLDIVYEDDDLLVVNKAKGMVVHPAPGSEDRTLVNALLFHCKDTLSSINGIERPGIVHRLDKDTTGLLVVAKNDIAHRALQLQIFHRTASRRYLAVVWGNPHFTEAVVDVPMGRDPVDRKRMAVVDPHGTTHGRPAVTMLTVRERIGNDFALLECTLQTGRTHQIRVHCAFAGYAVVGDPTYGGLKRVGLASGGVPRGPLTNEINAAIQSLHGQALHAFSLAFDHPRTGARLTFEAPPPSEMQNLLALLRRAA